MSARTKSRVWENEVDMPFCCFALKFREKKEKGTDLFSCFHGQLVSKLTPIIPGQNTVLTDPELPGFKMTVPAGVQIIGWDGQPNTKVGVIAMPVDQSSLSPIPAGQTSRVVYLFSFGKMGGGLPTGDVPVDTPNDVGGMPGDKVDLYFYNEAPDGTVPNQWERYGTGTVSSDGLVIVSDINPATGMQYGMPRFCCGGRRNVPTTNPPSGPASGGSGAGGGGGDPVDLSTGFFHMTKTDMVLSGRVPMNIVRTYRTNLTGQGAFGIGTTASFDLFLRPPPNGSPDALVLFSPGNRQDIFSRQPNGTFINRTTPAMLGAVVSVNVGGRVMTFKDRTVWTFDSSGRLIGQEDRNGNKLTIARDGQGRAIELAASAGRTFRLSYTGENIRIDSIQDSLGRRVLYSYDASGYLTRVKPRKGDRFIFLLIWGDLRGMRQDHHEK